MSKWFKESIKASLGPHYQSALKVTTYGDAMGLYNQVEKFNPSDKEARKGLLIAQFWEAYFQKEGANDLAVWINYITTSVYDLEQLGEAISDAFFFFFFPTLSNLLEKCMNQ